MSKNILKNVGINISDLSIVDVKLYNDFKCRIYEQYMASWKQSISDIEVHPILRTYYLFKDDFCLESYLININDYVVRKCLSKLRMSSHSLEIEIGRHKNPKVPVDQRICNKCVLNVIEDEFHFLVICPKYKKDIV